jgi:hypothetical protein
MADRSNLDCYGHDNSQNKPALAKSNRSNDGWMTKSRRPSNAVQAASLGAAIAPTHHKLAPADGSKLTSSTPLERRTPSLLNRLWQTSAPSSATASFCGDDSRKRPRQEGVDYISEDADNYMAKLDQIYSDARMAAKATGASKEATSTLLDRLAMLQHETKTSIQHILMRMDAAEAAVKSACIEAASAREEARSATARAQTSEARAAAVEKRCRAVEAVADEAIAAARGYSAAAQHSVREQHIDLITRLQRTLQQAKQDISSDAFDASGSY